MNEAQSLLCRKSQALEYVESLLEYAEHSEHCVVACICEPARGCTCGLDALTAKARETFSTDDTF